MDISQDCQYITQLNVHITQDSVAAKQEDAPGRPGLTESNRHYLCIASLLTIINLIYIAQFDTNGILTALCIVIQYIQMQHVHI